MRSTLMIIFSLVVLGALNYGIYEKQQIKDNGEILLLELAPVDPRSLMQGDYMHLRYAIERVVPGVDPETLPQQGYMVIQSDENKVARLVRFQADEPLQPHEKRLRFRRAHGLHIIPDSFLFQEGHAEFYEKAKYGVFKFDDTGEHLLVGLANRDRKIINVPK